MPTLFDSLRHVLVVCLGLSVAAMASPPPASAQSVEAPVALYDMTSLFSLDLNEPAQRRQFYDETLLAVSLQGLANRDAARLFLRYNQGPDDFWWAKAHEEGQWLHGRPVDVIQSLDALLERFKGFYEGVVVWDERVPATSNLAATIAGIENRLALRLDRSPDSVYTRCVNGPLKDMDIRFLTAADGSPLFTGEGMLPGANRQSSGSPKNDAYRWLMESYIRPGKTNPHLLGFYLDGFWLKCWHVSAPQNHTLTNLDYIIANRGVVFDLNVWEDEAPVDDPNQTPGTDAETLKELLRACYDGFDGDGVIHVAGFTPWAYKYTDFQGRGWNAGGKRSGVPTEWKYAEVLSCFNAYLDADALGYSSMVNASFYQHYPLPAVIPQNPKPTRSSLTEAGILDGDGRIIPRNYYAHYQGDYDAAAWVYWKMPEMMNDPTRGQIPMTWAINPNLAQRFAFGMYWIRQNRTPNDSFIAGDSGAGYVNLYHLSEPRRYSGLPSGMAAWERHCAQFYRQWDVTISGFNIDGNTPGMTKEAWDAYARFSPDGIIPQRHDVPQGVYRDAPFLRIYGDLTGHAERDAETIRSHGVRHRPNFIYYRSILQSPSYYLAIDKALQESDPPEFRLVDLYTLMWLVKEYETHREVYAEVSAVARATAIRATPAQNDGLSIRRNGDGPFEVVTVKGRECWARPAGPQTTYLYFQADEFFLYHGRKPLKIAVTYLDQGQGALGLSYDGADGDRPGSGMYRGAEETASLENTGQWRTTTFQAPAPLFEKRQNGRADFRLHCHGDALYVSDVRVIKDVETND